MNISEYYLENEEVEETTEDRIEKEYKEWQQTTTQMSQYDISWSDYL